MFDPNVKFNLFRREPDVTATQQHLIQKFGCAALQIDCRYFAAPQEHNTCKEFSIEGSQKETLEVGTKIVTDFFNHSGCEIIQCWQRIGPVKPGDLKCVFFVGWNKETDIDCDLQELSQSLQESLPISIQPLYNTKITTPIYGDIVAMNRSTLREIIGK